MLDRLDTARYNDYDRLKRHFLCQVFPKCLCCFSYKATIPFLLRFGALSWLRCGLYGRAGCGRIQKRAPFAHRIGHSDWVGTDISHPGVGIAAKWRMRTHSRLCGYCVGRFFRHMRVFESTSKQITYVARKNSQPCRTIPVRLSSFSTILGIEYRKISKVRRRPIWTGYGSY